MHDWGISKTLGTRPQSNLGVAEHRDDRLGRMIWRTVVQIECEDLLICSLT